MGNIDEYFCSCGTLIADCSFWSQLVQACREQGIPMKLQDFGTHFKSSNATWSKILGAQIRGPIFETIRRFFLNKLPGLHREYLKILNCNNSLIDLLLDGKQNDWFLDGSKDPNRLMYFKHSARWNIKVIVLYRDGRAQSNSSRHKSPQQFNYVEAAREWKKTIKQMSRVMELFEKDSYLELHYETLCERPSQTMEKLWQFLELDSPDIDWESDIVKGTSHILGNDMMRQRNQIKIRLDKKWMSELTDSNLADFEKVAGEANRKLGYSRILSQGTSD